MGECTKSIIMPGSARRTIQSAPTSTKHCSPGVSEPHPLARFRDQSPADQPGGRRRVDPVQATTLDVGGRHARALPLALAALHVFQVTPHRVCQAQDWSPSFRAGALHLSGVPIFTRECVEDLREVGQRGGTTNSAVDRAVPSRSRRLAPVSNFSPFRQLLPGY